MGGVTSNCSRVYNANDAFPVGQASDDATTTTTTNLTHQQQQQQQQQPREPGNGNGNTGANDVINDIKTRTTNRAGESNDVDAGDRIKTFAGNSHESAQSLDDGKRRHSMPGCSGGSGHRTEMSRTSAAEGGKGSAVGGSGGESIEVDTRAIRRIASTSARRHQHRNPPLSSSPSGFYGRAPSRQNPLVAAAGRTASTGSSCSGVGVGGSQTPVRGSFDGGTDGLRDAIGSSATGSVTTIGSNGVRIEAAVDGGEPANGCNRWRRGDCESRFEMSTGNCGVRFEHLVVGGPSAGAGTPGVVTASNAPIAGARAQSNRRSSIAFLPTYGGSLPTATTTSSGVGGLFPPRPSCLTGGTQAVSPMDRVNIGFGNATDLVANLISAASGGGGGGGNGGSCSGSRSPGTAKIEDQFWVPPTVWRKKRAQSLVPQKLSSEGSAVLEGLPGKNSSASSSLQEMTIVESPPLMDDVTSSCVAVAAAGVPLGPDVSQLRRRRASMQDALDFTKINASLYERPMLANQQKMFGRIQEENCGSLNLSLQYNADLSLLTVRLIRAQDLVPREGQSGLDPYCRLRLLPDRRHQLHSKVHKRTPSPEFDEDFVFDVGPSDLADRTLEILIYDATPAVGGPGPTNLSQAQAKTDECLGQVLLPFDEINLHATVETMWLWKGVTPYVKKNESELPPGELMFSVTYLNSAARLTVVVMKARNLKPAEDTKATANPFVRVDLMSSAKRVKKKRTSTKRNTLNPTWNEAIVFNLHGKEFGAGLSTGSMGTSSATTGAFGGQGSPGNATQLGSSGTAAAASLPGIQIELTVFSDNLLGTNEPLGRVTVGDLPSAGPGLAQWAELLAVRNAPARWHALVHQQSSGDG